jgi:hypothetical protein
MPIFGPFHPETLMTGVAPCRPAELQLTLSASDSPGQSVMSLSFQIKDCSSLSPASSVPAADVRAPEEADRRCGRSDGDRHGGGQVGAIRVGPMDGGAGRCDACLKQCLQRLQVRILRQRACGCPRVFDQFVTSCWVDSQRTLGRRQVGQLERLAGADLQYAGGDDDQIGDVGDAHAAPPARQQLSCLVAEPAEQPAGARGDPHREALGIVLAEL